MSFRLTPDGQNYYLAPPRTAFSESFAIVTEANLGAWWVIVNGFLSRP